MKKYLKKIIGKQWVIMMKKSKKLRNFYEITIKDDLKDFLGWQEEAAAVIRQDWFAFLQKLGS